MATSMCSLQIKRLLSSSSFPNGAKAERPIRLHEEHSSQASKLWSLPFGLCSLLFAHKSSIFQERHHNIHHLFLCFRHRIARVDNADAVRLSPGNFQIGITNSRMKLSVLNIQTVSML